MFKSAAQVRTPENVPLLSGGANTQSFDTWMKLDSGTCVDTFDRSAHLVYTFDQNWPSFMLSNEKKLALAEGILLLRQRVQDQWEQEKKILNPNAKMLRMGRVYYKIQTDVTLNLPTANVFFEKVKRDICSNFHWLKSEALHFEKLTQKAAHSGTNGNTVEYCFCHLTDKSVWIDCRAGFVYHVLFVMDSMGRCKLDIWHTFLFDRE